MSPTLPQSSQHTDPLDLSLNSAAQSCPAEIQEKQHHCRKKYCHQQSLHSARLLLPTAEGLGRRFQLILHGMRGSLLPETQQNSLESFTQVFLNLNDRNLIC